MWSIFLFVSFCLSFFLCNLCRVYLHQTPKHGTTRLTRSFGRWWCGPSRSSWWDCLPVHIIDTLLHLVDFAVLALFQGGVRVKQSGSPPASTAYLTMPVAHPVSQPVQTQPVADVKVNNNGMFFFVQFAAAFFLSFFTSCTACARHRFENTLDTFVLTFSLGPNWAQSWKSLLPTCPLILFLDTLNITYTSQPKITVLCMLQFWPQS